MTPPQVAPDVDQQRAEIDREVAGKTLGHWLEAAVSRAGARPAQSWKQGSGWGARTWAQVREIVARGAVGLAELGVGRGDTVAIMAPNIPEHVLADQAVVHAGATPSTFYDTLSADQIRYVADNCAAKVAILADPSYLERWDLVRGDLPALETIVLLEGAETVDDEQVVAWDHVLEVGAATLEEEPDAFETRWRAVEPDDPAVLIYTSGTTGPPKGVVLTHRNVMWETVAIERLAGLPEGISNVSYLPLAHIAERILSVYAPLLLAAHTYYCPDTKQAVEYVQAARPTFFFGVPRVWEKMQAGITAKLDAEGGLKSALAHRALHVARERVRRQQAGQPVSPLTELQHRLLEPLVLAKVREGVGLDRCTFSASAAAPLPPEVGEFFMALGLPLVEVYGMTETCGVVTGNPPDAIRIGTVGPSLDGVEVRLAEDGEVLARGPNNTPGYLGLPDENAALIDDDGWLHTGDIGTFDDHGYLQIVDRKKELIVTSSGKNISPVHIESLLKEHPLIGQALAYGDNQPYVTALIVLDEEVAPVWAAEHGVQASSIAALAEDPTVRAAVQEAVDHANARLARIEQVKTFEILPTEWTAESEELTPTLKLKRRVIHDKYRDRIDALYTR